MIGWESGLLLLLSNALFFLIVSINIIFIQFVYSFFRVIDNCLQLSKKPLNNGLGFVKSLFILGFLLHFYQLTAYFFEIRQIFEQSIPFDISLRIRYQ